MNPPKLSELDKLSLVNLLADDSWLIELIKKTPAQESDNYDDNYITSPMESGERGRASRVMLAKSFEGLDVFTAARAKDIEQLMALLIVRGLVNPDNLARKVVDFGMGAGPGAYVLKQYGGEVTGVDNEASSVLMAVKQGILPKERALVQDGFGYLTGLPSESLDFLAAYMMPSGFPHMRLYWESQKVLKRGGQLLITGGLVELKEELQRTVGDCGKVEEVITFSDEGTPQGNVAFVYTRR